MRPARRQEHVEPARARASGAEPFHKVEHDPVAIERLFVDLFLEAYKAPPQEIVLDLDATDHPLHGHQEGRFFHGYYDCYRHLPLYVFCARHLLAAKLRRSNIDALAGAVAEVERIVSQIRARWPQVKILLRADSGFARDELMAWCEANRVDYVFGRARNPRLVEKIEAELAGAAAEHAATRGRYGASRTLPTRPCRPPDRVPPGRSLPEARRLLSIRHSRTRARIGRPTPLVRKFAHGGAGAPHASPAARAAPARP